MRAVDDPPTAARFRLRWAKRSAYRKFSGNNAWSPKWDVYEHNLLSEYHIRYGGLGGIGY